jgi:hypothetical protein
MKIKVPLKKNQTKPEVEIVTTGSRKLVGESKVELKKPKLNSEAISIDNEKENKKVNAFSRLKEASQAYFQRIKEKQDSTSSNRSNKRKHDLITKSPEKLEMIDSGESKTEKVFKVKSQQEESKSTEDHKSKQDKVDKSVKNKKPAIKLGKLVVLNHYSYDFKVQFIECAKKHGLAEACLLKGVSFHTAKGWKKNYEKEGDEGLKDKRINNSAPINKKLDEYLVDLIKQRRSKGLIVNTNILRKLALQAPFTIRSISFQCSNGFISKFLKRNNLVRRRKTHAIQKWIDSTVEDISTYFNSLYKMSEDNNEIKPTFINIDESPIFFDMAPDSTFHPKGEKEIAVLSHSESKVRMSLLMAIASDGSMLNPMMLFVYKYSGKGTRDFPIKYEKYKNLTKPWMLRFNESGFTTSELIIEYRKVPN